MGPGQLPPLHEHERNRSIAGEVVRRDEGYPKRVFQFLHLEHSEKASAAPSSDEVVWQWTHTD